MISQPSSTRAETRPSVNWWHGWGPLIVLPTAVIWRLPESWPRWTFMWTLAFTIYVGCKWLTWRRTRVIGVPIWRHLGYLLAWPGLDAQTFLKTTLSQAPRRPGQQEWFFALGKLAIGAGLFFLVARKFAGDMPLVVGWVGMIGLVMMLHFGSFDVLSCWWRMLGVDAKPLMNWPLLAVSFSEFWSRRWNTAFRDLTHRFLFRPLAARIGPRGATLAGFVFSGLVHELVISVPAGGGYGGPSLFFGLQGLALLAERTPIGRKIGLGTGWRGWLFTACGLLAPVCALFHPPFVLNVILPFMRACGAI